MELMKLKNQMAASRGFKVVFINDHDRIALSYGVPPFRRILRYKKEFRSIMTNGPEKFLKEIERVSKKFPNIIIIPGCITSAYYYWTGSWLKKNLTVHLLLILISQRIMLLSQIPTTNCPSNTRKSDFLGL
jgi:hypothetical protein